MDVGPFTLTGGGGGLQARQLYSIDIDERILRQERWVNSGAEWRATRRFLVSGGAEYRSFRYDPSARTASGNLTAAASLNRNNLTGTLALRYKLTSMTTLIATGDVIEDEFQLSAPGLSKTRSYRYMAGVELGEKAFISGRFLAGIRDFPASSSGSLPSYRGPAYQAELALPLFNRLRLVGTLLRDVYVSAQAVRTAEERARNTYVLTQLQRLGRHRPAARAHRPRDGGLHGRELPRAEHHPGRALPPRGAPLQRRGRPPAPLLRLVPHRRHGHLLPPGEHHPRQLLRPLGVRRLGRARPLRRDVPRGCIFRE